MCPPPRCALRWQRSRITRRIAALVPVLVAVRRRATRAYGFSFAPAQPTSTLLSLAGAARHRSDPNPCEESFSASSLAKKLLSGDRTNKSARPPQPVDGAQPGIQLVPTDGTKGHQFQPSNL